MKLTELRYLVALSKEKHFGRAAKRSFVSQPTLSVAVNKLEAKLGVKLFERFHHDVRITDIGKQVLAQAVRALEEVDRIEAIAKQSVSQLTGPLSIWAIYTIAPYLFPRLLPILRKRAPDMPLVLGDGYTEVLREKIIQGDIDLAVVALPFVENGIVTRSIYRENFVCLLPSSHPLAKEDSIDEREFAKENVLLLGDGHCFRDQVLRACPSCHNSSAGVQHVEGTSIETLKQMVASGLGVTVLPASAVHMPFYKDLVVVKPFRGATPFREIGLAWRVSFPRPKVIDVIIDALKEAKVDGTQLELFADNAS
jgi:LysR family hydrogen peroxide-inducible transcriptional activator